MKEGTADGNNDGNEVGIILGSLEGIKDGTNDGVSFGDELGYTDGNTLGKALGNNDIIEGFVEGWRKLFSWGVNIVFASVGESCLISPEVFSSLLLMCLFILLSSSLFINVIILLG